MRSITLFGGCVALLALSGSAAGAQTITQIIDAAGDGTHILDGASGIAVEPAVEGAGNVYVTGNYSDNVFKLARHGSRTEIIDGTGDGTHGLDAANSIAMDASGNVYVTGYTSGNAFKITPDGTINEIIDANGDGTHGLSGPRLGVRTILGRAGLGLPRRLVANAG